jgi:hypothetical protein
MKVEPMLRDRTNRFVFGAAVIGLLAGGMMAVRWPRVSGALAWSMLGMTLALVMGASLVGQSRPGWLEELPARATEAMPQLAGIGLLAAIGTILQYCLARRGQGAPAASADINDDGDY